MNITTFIIQGDTDRGPIVSPDSYTGLEIYDDGQSYTGLEIYGDSQSYTGLEIYDSTDPYSGDSMDTVGVQIPAEFPVL